MKEQKICYHCINRLVALARYSIHFRNVNKNVFRSLVFVYGTSLCIVEGRNCKQKSASETEKFMQEVLIRINFHMNKLLFILGYFSLFCNHFCSAQYQNFSYFGIKIRYACLSLTYYLDREDRIKSQQVFVYVVITVDEK